MLKRLCTGEYIKAQPGFVLRWLYSGVFLIPYYDKLNTVSYCFYEAVVLGVLLFLNSVISVYGQHVNLFLQGSVNKFLC